MATGGQSTSAESVMEAAEASEMEVIAKEEKETEAKVEEKSAEECKAEQREAEPAKAGGSKDEEPSDLDDSSHSSDSSAKVKLLGGYSNRVAETAEVAKVAAITARSASLASKKVIQASLEAVATGKKQTETAFQRVEDAAENDEAEYYRRLAAEYASATDSVTSKASDVDAAADAAEVAAAKADEAVAELSGIEEENSSDATQKIEMACWAATTANAAAIVAFKTEYIALTEMRKCWHHIDDVEIRGSAIVQRSKVLRGQDDCGNPRDARCLKIVNIFIFLLGVAVLCCVELMDFKQSSRDGLLSMGTMFVSWPCIQGLYSLFIYCRNKRLKSKISKAREEMANIDKRLRELATYFENNGIDFSLDEE